MIGGIYTEEKCAICGASMKDNRRNAVCCPNHPNQIAHRLIVKFGRQVKKRFISYDLARRLLNGLRYEVDKGTFDARDYQFSQPLGFESIVEQYLKTKEKTLKPRSLYAVKHDLALCANFWNNRNIKGIQFGVIEDLLGSLDLSDKSKHNLLGNLRALLNWCLKRREIEKLPDLPTVSYVSQMRKTIPGEVQAQILNEIQKLTTANPRIHLAIRWLMTYTNLRPGDIRIITEADVDHRAGIVWVKDHKTAKTIGPKPIVLIPEDVDHIRSLPRAFPKLNFFRKEDGTGLGRLILWRYWKRACANLGIKGVDLYGGTRHSTMIYQRQELGMTPEEIRRLSMHRTLSSFNRYLEVSVEELRRGYTKGTHFGTPPKTSGDLKSHAPQRDTK